MPARLDLDHVVILVNDLAVATRNYTALGFTVVPGGEHPTLGSRNALIAFADGTYLELITFKVRSGPRGSMVPKHERVARLASGSRSPVACRVLAWESAGEGLVDFALVPSSIDDVLAAAVARGLAVAGPFPGGRARPDGVQVEWQFGIPDGFDLPFLCADVTPRDLRVPGGSARQHANGAAGIAALDVVLADLEHSLRRYHALLGIAGQPEDAPPPEETRSARLHLDTTTLRLVQPLRPAGSLRAQLDERGEGPCALTLRVPGLATTRRLDLASAHGVPIVLAS